MTHAAYADAGPQGPGRGGTRQRTGPTLWIVWHTSEGGEGETSAENLAAFIRSPASNGNVASYQVIFDTDRVLQIMPPDMRSHHAAGANDKGVGGCVPGRADQTRAEWLDGVTARYLEQGCRWAADMCELYGIPPQRITAAQMTAGAAGIVDHNTVRQAFGETSHTDCGPGFPWDVMLARVNELLAPAPIPEPPVTSEEKPVFINKVDRDTYEVGDRIQRRTVNASGAAAVINNSEQAGVPLFDWATGRTVVAIADVTGGARAPALGKLVD